MKMSLFLRILFALVLLFSITLPLFERKHSDFEMVEDSFEYAAKKWAEGAWSFITDAVITIKDKIIEEDEVMPKSSWEKTLDQFYTGYGYGVSSLGGAKKAWNNYKHKEYHVIPILTVSIVVITLIQIIFLNTLYKRRNPILGFINILLVLSIFGNCISSDKYDGLLYGSLIFVLIHSIYMLFFYYYKPKSKLK